MSSPPNESPKPEASVFGAYSAYYDLLYKDKDYAGEAEYVRSLVAQHHPAAQSIIDFGCGTGRHALLLAEHGYQVCGVDTAPEMLSRAQAQLSAAAPELAARRASSGFAPEFVPGDVRTVRLGRRFDVAVSLFHVMSYQQTNRDLRAAFETAKAHLKPGGVFIFDCWYGPAVLHVGPTVRVRRFENEQLSVTRVAEPVIHPNANLVDVNYQVLIKDLATSSLAELRETHTLRYLFFPEVAAFAEAAGFQLEASVEFMTNAPLGFDTWTAAFVARSLPE